eukprot:10966353-Alexandrium_andersonii.AAC.1
MPTKCPEGCISVRCGIAATVTAVAVCLLCGARCRAAPPMDKAGCTFGVGSLNVASVHLMPISCLGSAAT